jgi:hypothetical protein
MYQGNDPTVKAAFLVHWDVPRDFAIFMLEENEQTPQQALSIENLITTSLINYTPERIFTVGYNGEGSDSYKTFIKRYIKSLIFTIGYNRDRSDYERSAAV